MGGYLIVTFVDQMFVPVAYLSAVKNFSGRTATPYV